MARGNTLDLEILGGVLFTRCVSVVQIRQWWGVTHSCELKNFGGEVFEDCSNVDSSLGSHAHLVLGVVLQETLDTTTRELQR
jgi:hypothetical protein